jgi:formylglycine-generating enzyme required for sulfatase activity
MKPILGASLLIAVMIFPNSAGFAQQANSAPAATATKASQDKPDLKELLKGTTFTNGVGIVMVKISPQLWAGRYPVTQAEYRTVTGGNPSQFKGDRNPVENVSWNDANAFCMRLMQKEAKESMLPDGFVYVIPTQAEWEQLVDGADLKDAVTSQAGDRKGTAPVGSLGANNLGLHDMRGNVWEWCLDPEDKPYRVLRGGAWNTSLEPNLRLEFRWYSNGPDDKKDTYGFRCVLKPK